MISKKSADVLKFSKLFVVLAQQSAQAGDIQMALENAKLWGGSDGGFDANGPVAKAIFELMDKLEFQGKVDAELIIDNNFGVKIAVKGSGPKTIALQQGIQSMFGPKMTKALKMSKISPPTDKVVVPWLSQVG